MVSFSNSKDEFGIFFRAIAVFCLLIPGPPAFAQNPSLDLVGSISGTGDSLDFTIQGNYAYLVGYGDRRVRIVDISNTTTPTLVSSSYVAERVLGLDIQVSGNLIYVASGTTTGARGGTFEILDATTLTTPTFLGKFTAADPIGCVELNGTTVYAACDESGMRVVNAINPASPAQLGVRNGFNFSKLVRFNNYLLAIHDAVPGHQNEVINVTNPASPSHVTDYVTTSTVTGVVAGGNYAYLAGRHGTISVANMTNPAAPVQVATIRVPTDLWVEGMAYEAPYLYVTQIAPNSGLYIYDVSNPASPQFVLYQSIPATYDVKIHNNLIYVLSGSSAVGLQIYQWHQVPVELSDFRLD